MGRLPRRFAPRNDRTDTVIANEVR